MGDGLEGWEEAGAATMWPSADTGDSRQVRLFRAVESRSRVPETEVLPVPSVDDAGPVRHTDFHMSPTALCAIPGCGHVRWRHGPYPENPCNVPGCVCIRGWSFYVAEYQGYPKE
jgi:hypothetical protein